MPQHTPGAPNLRGRGKTGRALAAVTVATLLLGGCVDASAPTTSGSRTTITDGTATAGDIRAAITSTSNSGETAQVRSHSTLKLTSKHPSASNKSRLPRIDTSISGIATLDGAFANLTVDLGLTRIDPVKVALRGETAWIKDAPESPWEENPSLTEARESVTVRNSLNYFADGNPLAYQGSELFNGQNTHKYTTTGNVTTEVAQALVSSGTLPALSQTTPVGENYTASIWIDEHERVVRVEVEVPVLSVLTALVDQDIDMSSVSSAVAVHTLSLRSFGKYATPTQQPTDKEPGLAN